MLCLFARSPLDFRKVCKHERSFAPSPGDLRLSQRKEGPWATTILPWSNSCFPQHWAQHGAQHCCWKSQPCCFTMVWEHCLQRPCARPLYHRITEWCGLKGTLEIIYFHEPGKNVKSLQWETQKKGMAAFMHGKASRAFKNPT